MKRSHKVTPVQNCTEHYRLKVNTIESPGRSRVGKPIVCTGKDIASFSGGSRTGVGYVRKYRTTVQAARHYVQVKLD